MESKWRPFIGLSELWLSLTLQLGPIVSVILESPILAALVITSVFASAIYAIRRLRVRAGTSVSGTISNSLRGRMSEDEMFRLLATSEVNIQIVKICETPLAAKEIAKSLGAIYPGHKEHGFPQDKLGEHLAHLERAGILRFYGENWVTSEIGMKMVRKYFG